MKGMKVIYSTYEYGHEETYKAKVISEPYPKIFPEQLNVRDNGGTYVGAASKTCVVLDVKGKMIVDVEISDIRMSSRKWW